MASKPHSRQDVEIIRRALLRDGIAAKALSNLEQQFAALEEQLETARRDAEFGEACREICSRSRHPWWEISQRAKDLIGVDRFTGTGHECQKPASNPASGSEPW